MVNVDVYPDYWKLPCNYFEVVLIDKNNQIWNQINNLMNKTLVQHQSGQGLIPGSKLEANYYEIEKIELIQSPSVWRNYIYTKQYIQKKIFKCNFKFG